MEKTKTSRCVVFLSAALVWFSCKTEPNPTTAFLACQADCTGAALKVKDAYLQDPKSVLALFAWNGSEGNEAKFNNWLDLLRDSFFFNADAIGLTHAQLAEVRQQMITGTEPFTNDNNIGPLANRLIEVLGPLAFLTEGENPAPSYTGTFAYELPGEAGSGEMKIKQLDGRSIQFSLFVVAGPPAHNQGEMQGAATLRPDGVIEIVNTEYGGTCRIEVTIEGGTATLKTVEGDSPTCGFGHNVMADGVYKLTTQDDPFAVVPIDPAKLEGNWVSTEDPKSEVKIGGGRYVDIYDGEKIADSAYTFHATCPSEDCGAENGGMPCIKVTGQDVLCYTVLFADGANLEISMITGRGNSLSFTKK